MEAIKNSRIIVVLLILYIGIAILVVTLDQNQKSKDKSSTTTTETKETNTKTKSELCADATCDSCYNDEELNVRICSGCVSEDDEQLGTCTYNE